MVLGFFARWREAHRSYVGEDGFGQSLADDARFVVRFRALKRRPIEWRQPTAGQARDVAAHRVLGRFGDDTFAVGEINELRCLVRERIWHGWPDPPQFVFFALDCHERIWAARDFDHWPASWTRPGEGAAHLSAQEAHT